MLFCFFNIILEMLLTFVHISIPAFAISVVVKSLFLFKGRYLGDDALLSTMQTIIVRIITVYESSNSIYSCSCGLLQQVKLQSVF